MTKLASSALTLFFAATAGHALDWPQYGPYAITWGHSSSPTIYADTLILQCDHEPASYLLALDIAVGN